MQTAVGVPVDAVAAALGCTSLPRAPDKVTGPAVYGGKQRSGRAAGETRRRVPLG